MVRVRSRHGYWPEAEVLPSRGHCRAGTWGGQGAARVRRGIMSGAGRKSHSRHLTQAEKRNSRRQHATTEMPEKKLTRNLRPNTS